MSLSLGMWNWGYGQNASQPLAQLWGDPSLHKELGDIS